jgi:RNA polymerase sigma-70 factor (ECF subfamily)
VGEAAAGDVVSETFLVAWRRRADIPRDHPGAWLFAITANVVRHEMRGSERRTSLHDRTAAGSEALAAGLDDAEATRLAERLLVRQTLATLSESDQEVLRLVEWDELTPLEAATVLNISVSAFKVRLHRARKRFAAQLARAHAGHPVSQPHLRAVR